jgi:hypothetical protein
MTKIFYSLTKLEEYQLTDLKYRMIKYRLNKLLKQGKIVEGNLAYRTGTKWHIHYSLIDLFQAERKHASHTKIEFRHELTVNMKDNYDVEFYKLIGEKVIADLQPFTTIYRIERCEDRTKAYHIHFCTNAEYELICNSIAGIGLYLDIDILNNKNTHLSKLNNKGQFFCYINKAVVEMNSSK